MRETKLQSRQNAPGHDLLWWLITLFGLPISLPWLIYNVYNLMVKKRKKIGLKGKVNYFFILL